MPVVSTDLCKLFVASTESSDTALRAKFVEVLSASGMTQAEAADALGLSEGTISKKARGDLPVKKRDVDALERLVERHKRPVEKVPRRTSDDPAEEWSPNPALKNAIPKRAYDVAIGYCRRLVAAGLERNEIEALERIMIDSRYAKANSRRGRELSEEDWILLVDDAWDAIRETLSGRGIRV